MSDQICKLCKGKINNDSRGDPCIEFKDSYICSNCYIHLLPVILEMDGAGDGGIICLVWRDFMHQKGYKIAKRKNYSKKSKHSYNNKLLQTEED